MNLQKGFTLLEVMIVVAVVGILVAVALPSYNEYVIRTKRGDMKTEMMRISQDAQRFKVARRSFTGANAASGGVRVPNSYPDTNPLYDVNFTITPDGSGWELTATPRSNSAQSGDGILCLNHQGQKFWSKGATTCSLNATSSWD